MLDSVGLTCTNDSRRNKQKVFYDNGGRCAKKKAKMGRPDNDKGLGHSFHFVSDQRTWGGRVATGVFNRETAKLSRKIMCVCGT